MDNYQLKQFVNGPDYPKFLDFLDGELDATHKNLVTAVGNSIYSLQGAAKFIIRLKSLREIVNGPH